MRQHSRVAVYSFTFQKENHHALSRRRPALEQFHRLLPRGGRHTI